MKIEIGRLTVREPFKSLFPVEPDVVKALTADMKANGFDAAQSVFAWKAPDGELVLVDGHMRLQAAKAARLGEVHATVRRFANEDEAFDFAITMQRDRRNLPKLAIAEAIARAELARAHNDIATPARSVGPRDARGRVRGSTKDPVRTAVVEKAATKGVGTRTADQALANVRAENGNASTSKPRIKDPLAGMSKSDEAILAYRMLASLNDGELAARMNSTLRAMFKLVEDLDRKQAEGVVSAIWGVVDGAYRDKRSPAAMTKLAAAKEN
jgi:ParB-like chromosome segregation protein Spo0J